VRQNQRNVIPPGPADSEDGYELMTNQGWLDRASAGSIREAYRRLL